MVNNIVLFINATSKTVLRAYYFVPSEQSQQPTDTPILPPTYASTFCTAQAAQWSDSWGGAV